MNPTNEIKTAQEQKKRDRVPISEETSKLRHTATSLEKNKRNVIAPKSEYDQPGTGTE